MRECRKQKRQTYIQKSMFTVFVIVRTWNVQGTLSVKNTSRW